MTQAQGKYNLPPDAVIHARNIERRVSKLERFRSEHPAKAFLTAITSTITGTTLVAVTEMSFTLDHPDPTKVCLYEFEAWIRYNASTAGDAKFGFAISVPGGHSFVQYTMHHRTLAGTADNSFQTSDEATTNATSVEGTGGSSALDLKGFIDLDAGTESTTITLMAAENSASTGMTVRTGTYMTAKYLGMY